MLLRTTVLALLVAGSLSTVIVTAADKQQTSGASLVLHFVPEGNLQVGAPGELLPEPVSVRTTPGAEVRFRSPDLGIIEESGSAMTTVRADENGLASVHVRLGRNLGNYTVVVTPAEGDGTIGVYTFRAITRESMQARDAKIAQGRTNAARSVDAGGAR